MVVLRPQSKSFFPVKPALYVKNIIFQAVFATSFVRGRFEFEASLHELNGIGNKEKSGGTKRILDELGVSNLVEWIQVKNAYRLISKEEGIDFILPFGVDNIIKACDTLCENGGIEAKKK